MKKLSFSIPFRKKKPESVETSTEPVSFFVVDDAAKLEASRILSKVKIPATPSLHGLEKAYLFSESFLRKLNKNNIQIVERKNLSKEEAYQLNVKIFDHLIEQRNAIIGVIEKMVQPLIKNAAGVNIQLGDHTKRISVLEDQVSELQEMLDKVYGRHPQIPPLPDGKMPWGDSLKKASEEIIKIYEADCKAEIRNYRTLRDASDDFYDRHRFTYKLKLTKDMLYENVKKARSPWLGKSGEEKGMIIP